MNRISDVMVSMLASSAVDRGFQSQLGQTKDYKIGICCFSAKHAGEKAKIDWIGIRIICPSGATCLPTDYCFSELATSYKNGFHRIGLEQSGPHHHLIENELVFASM